MRFKYITILLILILPFHLQSNNISDWHKKIKSALTKCDLQLEDIIQIAHIYIKYGKIHEALKLQKHIKNRDGEFLKRILGFPSTKKYIKINHLNEISQSLLEIKESITKVDILLKLTSLYLQYSNIEKARICVIEANNLVDDIKDDPFFYINFNMELLYRYDRLNLIEKFNSTVKKVEKYIQNIDVKYIKPGEKFIWTVSLASLLIDLKKYPAGEKYLQLSTKYLPDSTDVHYLKNYFTVMRLFIKMDSISKANKILEKLIKSIFQKNRSFSNKRRTILNLLKSHLIKTITRNQGELGFLPNLGEYKNLKPQLINYKEKLIAQEILILLAILEKKYDTAFNNIQKISSQTDTSEYYQILATVFLNNGSIKKSLQLEDKIKDNLFKTYFYLNISDEFIILKQNKRACKFLKKGLMLVLSDKIGWIAVPDFKFQFIDLCFKAGYIRGLKEIKNNYINSKRPDLADRVYLKIVELLLNLNNVRECNHIIEQITKESIKSNAFLYLAHHFVKKENFESANIYFSKAMAGIEKKENICIDRYLFVKTFITLFADNF